MQRRTEDARGRGAGAQSGAAGHPGVTESWQVTEAPSTLTVRVMVDAVSGMRLLLETDMWTMGTTPAI